MAQWSDRQRALLDGIGIRLWQWLPADVDAAPAVSLAEAVGVPQGRAGAAVVDLPAAPAAPEEAPAVVRAALVAHPTAPAVPEPRRSALLPRDDAPAAPPGDDVRRLDWPALRAAVAGCTACALSTSRTQTVFGAGHPHAHWMVVGEAPGEQEDRLGEPFVGRPGELLDNMLRAAGLSRGPVTDSVDSDAADPARRAYVANAVRCRPPADRNPLAAELAACEQFLARQIELVRPRVVLAMGAFAVRSLLKTDEPIGRLRGRLHRGQGVPLVVTFSLGYLLRHPHEKARAWDDLCLAQDAAR